MMLKDDVDPSVERIGQGLEPGCSAKSWECYGSQNWNLLVGLVGNLVYRALEMLDCMTVVTAAEEDCEP